MKPPSPATVTPSAAQAVARRAWTLLYSDSQRCIELAEEALALGRAQGDLGAEAWALLVRGLHLIWYSTPAAAAGDLSQAQRHFHTLGDRAGHLLSEVGLARCLWREGRYQAALDRALPLRAEGLNVLQHDELGMLLNVIAGCYSLMGDSEQAFAYMYQALNELRPMQAQGFEVVLHCNLAHELIQLGDHHQALSYVEEGVTRCAQLRNPRLMSVLLINRVICLNSLDRPQEALADVQRLLALAPDETGRGRTNTNFETLALVALRAGDLALARQLVARAKIDPPETKAPDERLTLLVVEAETLCTEGRWAQAKAILESAEAAVHRSRDLSLRIRCLFHQALSSVQEHEGDAPAALSSLRHWQRLHTERGLQASRARYQAASLQTELRRMQQNLDEIDARRRATEQARAELEAINLRLQQKVDEVQALQAELKQQATRDFLTGLFNRRHLNDVLPQMLAHALREEQTLSVAIIDLDHFKSVNDRYGHGAGDQLLAAFGRLLIEQGRKSDLAFRFGGEEFCLLMPHTDAYAAQGKVQGLLKAWRAQVFRTDAGPLGGNTFSAGVADSQAEACSIEQLLKSADDRLLKAKRTGRNQVVCADMPDTSFEPGFSLN